jgi:hypothetical protein
VGKGVIAGAGRSKEENPMMNSNPTRQRPDLAAHYNPLAIRAVLAAALQVKASRAAPR